MMMTERERQLLDWRDDYLIGVEELDYEHRDLFNQLNALQLELASDYRPFTVEKTLEEIYTRIVTHFALEENYMREHKFANYARHKKEHEDYLEGMREIIRQVSVASSPEELDDLFFRMRNWITNHILHSDKELIAVDAH